MGRAVWGGGEACSTWETGQLRWREGASVKDGRKKQRRTWGLTISLATPSCVQKLQAASHGPSWVFSESRMREIRLSGSMSGLCQEDEKSSCCTKDEGGPFGAAL